MSLSSAFGSKLSSGSKNIPYLLIDRLEFTCLWTPRDALAEIFSRDPATASTAYCPLSSSGSCCLSSWGIDLSILLFRCSSICLATMVPVLSLTSRWWEACWGRLHCKIFSLSCFCTVLGRWYRFWSGSTQPLAYFCYVRQPNSPSDRKRRCSWSLGWYN